MPKRMTEKQFAANRRNALRSTGPRTPQGQAASKMNAMKHGILSTQVLVAGRFYSESSQELQALHGRFWEEYQPEGTVEEMLVDQIVTAHWRLRRALTAESGEIALSVDNGQRRRDRGDSPTLQWMKWTAVGDPTHAMRESSIGCAVLVNMLKEVRTAVERAGGLKEEVVQGFTARLGGKPNTLALSLEAFCEKPGTGNTADDATQAEQKAGALAFLDREIDRLYRARECIMEQQEQEDESRQAAAVLPSANVLDKILRYETKLERQMYRAMAQLERVQRMRRGEMIPAPLSVEVSQKG